MKTVRCAVYTRKSSEEGLELRFNSLHAQRESCEAYILSQAGEGWTCIPKLYDDGGISGGHMQRPGLKALIADIEAELIDVIVVYKVDRLTRSLTDFSKLVDVFDTHEVSFVSVTQAFNTTNSMGRLTLNVLLSFAQFEREISGERIRDKIALSRRKGLWTGGLAPIGYDVIEKALVINESEAKTVIHIYERYAALKNVRLLQHEFKAEGYVSKLRTSKKGKLTGGKPFGRGALYTILKNPIYLGLIQHKGETFDGAHEAVVSKPLFDKVQRILASNRTTNVHKLGAKNRSLLSGKLFTEDGNRFTPSGTTKNGRSYRYYVETRDRAADTPSLRLPAHEFEASVTGRVTAFLNDQVALIDALEMQTSSIDLQKDIWVKARAIMQKIMGSPSGQDIKLLLSGLISKVIITGRAEGYELILSRAALALHLELPSKPEADVDDNDGSHDIILNVELALKTCNNGKKVITGNVPAQEPCPNPILIAAIITAHRIKSEYISGDPKILSSIGERLGLDKRKVWAHLKLAFLAPDIQLAILQGLAPKGLTLKDIMQGQLPSAWDQQNLQLGFCNTA